MPRVQYAPVSPTYVCVEKERHATRSLSQGDAKIHQKNFKKLYNLYNNKAQNRRQHHLQHPAPGLHAHMFTQ